MSEWVEWKGGKDSPVDIKKPVYIKLRSGVIKCVDRSIAASWVHRGDHGDIVAYKTKEENK